MKPVRLAWILERPLIVAPECDKRRKGASSVGSRFVLDLCSRLGKARGLVTKAEFIACNPGRAAGGISLKLDKPFTMMAPF